MSTDVKTMNRKVFKAGMKKSHRIIHTHVQDILSSACERLLADAVQSKEFQGFTGNTQTSYACGIYMDGKLAYCSFQESWNRPPDLKWRKESMCICLILTRGMPEA